MQLSQHNVPFEEIVTSMSNAVIVVDREGTIVYVNPAYSRIMARSPQQVLGRKLADVTPNSRTLKVLETGLPIACDVFSSEALGLDLVMNATPIFQDGELCGAVAVFLRSQDLMEQYAIYRRSHGLVNYYQDLLLKEHAHAGSFATVVGASAELSRIVAMARRVAETDATVLITGENGAGKDVLAQAIMRASARRAKPFISVNCAAIPDTLLESELFGFAGGAFTGAARGGKLGKFELAEGGTIFLDEVGDMSSSMQSKLLRVLHEREIEKVGSTMVTRVDVRVIAATNRNLEQMVAEGKFREDLLYRLNLFPLHLPALRDRKEDIPMLALHFLKQLCTTYNRSLVVAPEALEALARFDWPGNVRQLRNVMERAVILCDADVLLPEHLGPPFNRAEPGAVLQAATGAAAACEVVADQGELKREIRKLERQIYEDALSSCSGNKSLAMKRIGVSRRTFYKRLHELDLFAGRGAAQAAQAR